MTDIARVRDGFCDFANQVIIPSLPKNKQFITGMAVGVMCAKTDEIAKSLEMNEAVKALGIVNDQGIDIEVLYKAAKEQMRKSGNFEMELPIIGGLRFDEADLDALYQAIMR